MIKKVLMPVLAGGGMLIVDVNANNVPPSPQRPIVQSRLSERSNVDKENLPNLTLDVARELMTDNNEVYLPQQNNQN